MATRYRCPGRGTSVPGGASSRGHSLGPGDSGCREPLCEPSKRHRTPADKVERVTDQPDLYTTAGKIADLRARYQEGGRGRRDGSEESRARKENSPLASASTCSSTPARSPSSTSTSATAPRRSAWTRPVPTATPSSPASARSTAARWRCYAQDFSTFGGSLGEVAGERSSRSWSMRPPAASRSSACSTPAVRASRRVWSRSASTARSSA